MSETVAFARLAQFMGIAASKPTPEKDDGEWYIPYTGTYEEPKPSAFSYTSNSVSGDYDSDGGRGRSRRERPLSGSTYTTRRSGMSATSSPRTGRQPHQPLSFLSLDTSGIGESPAPNPRGLAAAAAAAAASEKPSYRQSFLSFMTFSQNRHKFPAHPHTVSSTPTMPVFAFPGAGTERPRRDTLGSRGPIASADGRSQAPPIRPRSKSNIGPSAMEAAAVDRLRVIPPPSIPYSDTRVMIQNPSSQFDASTHPYAAALPSNAAYLARQPKHHASVDNLRPARPPVTIASPPPHSPIKLHKRLKASMSTPNLHASSKQGSNVPEVPNLPVSLEVQTLCDALFFPRPRFRAHVVSPPASPPLPPEKDPRFVKARDPHPPPLPPPKYGAPPPLSPSPPEGDLARAIRERAQSIKEREEWNEMAQKSFQNKRSRSLSRSRVRSRSKPRERERERERAAADSDREGGGPGLSVKRSIDYLAASVFSQGVTTVSTGSASGGGSNSHSRTASSTGHSAHQRADSWGRSALKKARSVCTSDEPFDSPNPAATDGGERALAGALMSDATTKLRLGRPTEPEEDPPFVEIIPQPLRDRSQTRREADSAVPQPISVPPPAEPIIFPSHPYASPSARQAHHAPEVKPPTPPKAPSREPSLSPKKSPRDEQPITPHASEISLRHRLPPHKHNKSGSASSFVPPVPPVPAHALAPPQGPASPATPISPPFEKKLFAPDRSGLVREVSLSELVKTPISPQTPYTEGSSSSSPFRHILLAHSDSQSSMAAAAAAGGPAVASSVMLPDVSTSSGSGRGDIIRPYLNNRNVSGRTQLTAHTAASSQLASAGSPSLWRQGQRDPEPSADSSIIRDLESVSPSRKSPPVNLPEDTSRGEGDADLTRAFRRGSADSGLGSTEADHSSLMFEGGASLTRLRSLASSISATSRPSNKFSVRRKPVKPLFDSDYNLGSATSASVHSGGMDADTLSYQTTAGRSSSEQQSPLAELQHGNSLRHVSGPSRFGTLASSVIYEDKNGHESSSNSNSGINIGIAPAQIVHIAGPSSQDSSPKMSPRALGSIDDLENYRDLFYGGDHHSHRSTPPMNRTPSSETRQHQQLQPPHSPPSFVLSRDSPSPFHGPFHDSISSRVEMGERLSFDSTTPHPFSRAALQGSEPATRRPPLRRRRSSHAGSARSASASPPPSARVRSRHVHSSSLSDIDIASIRSIPPRITKQAEIPENMEGPSGISFEDEDETFRLGRVGALPVSAGLSPGFNRLSTELALVQASDGDIEPSQSASRPISNAARNSLAIPSPTAGPSARLRIPSTTAEELARTSIVTSVTSSSARISGLSDFPTPPTANVIGSYFVEDRRRDSSEPAAQPRRRSQSLPRSRRTTFGTDADITLTSPFNHGNYP